MPEETVNWYEPDEEAHQAWAKWIATRPEGVRKVAYAHPPWKLWRLDVLDAKGEPTGKFQRVFVRSFQEHDDGKVTLTVAVDGRFNLVAFERQVFGIDPERLKATTLPEPGEVTGSMGIDPDDVARHIKRDQN